MIEYHRTLLADEVRTNAYRDAILRTVKPGDVVVDIGCGSGVLSFFACQAGAARVYAIDRGGMAGIAKFLSRNVGYADRITVLRDESTGVELPERADVLVTETIGTLGLDENMLGSIIDARARLLRENAAIVPSRLALSIVPVELPDRHEKHVLWWNERRYDLDLSPMRVFASNSILFLSGDTDAHLAAPAIIIDVDLTTALSTLVRGNARFVASRDSVLHGFMLWFTATLVDGVTITSADRGETHWSHGFFPLEEPIAMTRRAQIDVQLETEDGKTWNWRGNAAKRAFDQSTLFGAAPFG
ncbi:MAG TPA: 50S ribosomal protein L11 methyltransferase [Thermoanaerobaculia bacterium]|nr:50S ribosomal protein L11 methyltransferase [Thermoanaerobaculia bacterium]